MTAKDREAVMKIASGLAEERERLNKMASATEAVLGLTALVKALRMSANRVDRLQFRLIGTTPDPAKKAQRS